MLKAAKKQPVYLTAGTELASYRIKLTRATILHPIL